MSRYRWRTGFAGPCPAEEAAGIIEACAGDPGRVVEIARSPASPLHPAFNWDDVEAAEAHRIDQARKLIRSITVVYKERETKLFHLTINMANSPQRRVYMSIAVIAREEDKWRAAVQHWTDKLNSVRRALDDLAAIDPAGTGLDRIVADLRKVERRLINL